MIYLVKESQISYRKEKISNVTIKCSSNAYDVFKSIPEIENIMEYKEVAYVLYLNSANECVGVLKIGEGGINKTVVDQRIIFQGALLHNATSFILIHNHPSGRLSPSREDISLYEKLRKCGEILNIFCLDSIIATKNDYYSIRG